MKKDFSKKQYHDWILTRKQRLIVLEKRRRWLDKVISERHPKYESKRSYFADELEALEWALPVLWEVVYPSDPWPGLDSALEGRDEL